MNSELRRRFVREIMLDIPQVGAARFEDFATALDAQIFGGEIVCRGLNSEGASASGTVDAIDNCRGIEPSSEQNCFEPPFGKICKDVRHTRATLPHATAVTFYGSRECGPHAVPKIERLRHRLKAWAGIDF
jgi:hypothetical protein